jgi:hypothetical protein
LIEQFPAIENQLNCNNITTAIKEVIKKDIWTNGFQDALLGEGKN